MLHFPFHFYSLTITIPLTTATNNYFEQQLLTIIKRDQYTAELLSLLHTLQASLAAGFRNNMVPGMIFITVKVLVRET